MSLLTNQNSSYIDTPYVNDCLSLNSQLVKMVWCHVTLTICQQFECYITKFYKSSVEKCSAHYLTRQCTSYRSVLNLSVLIQSLTQDLLADISILVGRDLRH